MTRHDERPHHDPVLLSDEGSASAEEEAVLFENADLGLAAQRTDLAWSRSGLALMACGVVVAKGLPALSPGLAEPAEPLIGAVILVLGTLTWLLGLWAAHRRRATAYTARPVASYRDIALVAIGTAGVGTAGVVLVVLQHG